MLEKSVPYAVSADNSGRGSYDHFQDNGEDYAYRKGVYNLYHFHKNAQGVLETEMRHKNYPEYEQICLKIVGK